MSPAARARIAGALLVLVGVVAVAASLAFWLRATALDSERWAETVAPLPAEEAVADALAEYTVTEVLGGADLLALSGLLPDQFDALPGSATARLGGLAEGIAADVIASRAFEEAWTRANRAAHRAALAALDGEDAPALTDEGGVVIDLSPIITRLRTDIAAAGIQLAPISGTEGRIEILTVDERSATARAVRILRDLAFVLPLVAFVLAAVAVAVHPRRLRGLAGAGVALALSGLVTLAGLRVALSEAEVAVTEIDAEAVAAIGDALTRGLVDQSLLLAGAGGVLAILATAASALRPDPRPAPGVGLEGVALPWAGPAVVLLGVLAWPDPRLVPVLGAAAIAAAWWIVARLLVGRSAA